MRRLSPSLATGKNNLSGSHVPWNRVAAIRTAMNAIRQAFLSNNTTLRTSLGCVIGVDLGELATSTQSLVCQHSQELAPGGISHTLAHVTATEALDVQILDGDEAVLPYQAGGLLVLKVPPLVGDVLVQPPDLPAQLPIPAAASLATGSLALEERQFLLGISEPTGVINLLARGQAGEVGQPHINADFGFEASHGRGIGQFDLKDDVPIAQFISLEDSHLDLSAIGDRAMLKHTNESDVLDVELAASELEAVTIDIADRAEPASAFVTRIARFLTRLHTTKEGSKCLVQTAECLLDRGIIQPGSVFIEAAKFFELTGLIRVVNANTMSLPSVAAFLKRTVVQLTVNLNDAIQCLALLLVRIESVLVASFHRHISGDPRRQSGVLSESACAFGGHITTNPHQAVLSDNYIVLRFFKSVKGPIHLPVKTGSPLGPNSIDEDERRER